MSLEKLQKKRMFQHWSKWENIYFDVPLQDSLGERILGYFLDKSSSRHSFLELGTGGGRLLQYLLNRGFTPDVYGVDVSREFLRGGKTRHSRNLNLILADARNLPFRKESFNGVASRTVLAYIVGIPPKRNISQTFREVARVLKLGGVIFVDEQCVKYRAQSRIIFLLSYVLESLKISVPFFGTGIVALFLTPRELMSLLAGSGFKLCEWNEQARKMRLRRFRLTWLLRNIVYVSLTAAKNDVRRLVKTCALLS